VLEGAIIGFGKIAQTGHLPAYQSPEIGSRARIVAVAEPNPALQQRAAASISGIRVYASAEGLLCNERLDFADICTPPSVHLEGISALAEAGVHILCEKPLAATLANASAAAEILNSRSDLVFMPCHQYRYSPVWTPFRQFADERGRDSNCLAQFNVYRTQADPAFLAENPNWRTDPAISGGGILADTGVHYLYLTTWILGRPKSVTATVSTLRHHQESVEDTAIAVIECDRGIGEISLTWAADRRANSARIVSHRGSLVYDGRSLVRFNQDECETIPVPDASDKSQYVRLYVSLLDEFLSRIDSHESSSESLEEAHLSMALLQACYQSSASRRTVRFDFPFTSQSRTLAELKDE
jgi:predicted dehydrogenase